MAEGEVIPTLTQDERTVLMIAESGASMMAIGRWEPTVKALIQKGLMRAADEWNVYITSDGRKAIDAVEKAVDAEVEGAFRKYVEVVNVAQNTIQESTGNWRVVYESQPGENIKLLENGAIVVVHPDRPVKVRNPDGTWSEIKYVASHGTDRP